MGMTPHSFSILKQPIEVLADHPILAQGPQQTWDGMVEVIRGGFQIGTPVESLCYEIATCGRVLAEAFSATHDEVNPNETPNELIQDS